MIYTGVQSETPIDFTESQPPRNVQLYDAKGHPFNPWSRRLGRRLREAMNDVLSVVGVVERSKPGYGVDGSGQNGSNGLLIHSEEDTAGEIVSNFAEVDYEIWTSWHSSFVMRLLVMSFCTILDICTNHLGISSPARNLLLRFAQRSLHRFGHQKLFSLWIPQFSIEYRLHP